MPAWSKLNRLHTAVTGLQAIEDEDDEALEWVESELAEAAAKLEEALSDAEVVVRHNSGEHADESHTFNCPAC